MTLTQMHVWFRQFAQQMGLQNVRAILPEQIDLLINTSINDTINQVIKENIGVTNDRVITDNSKIGQINALKTLYRVAEIELGYTRWAGLTDRLDPSNMFPISATFGFNPAQARIGKISTNITNLKATDLKKKLPENLFIVDFAINYRPATKGYIDISGREKHHFTVQNDVSTQYESDGEETTYFPVRLIDDAFLADTLNDFILKPRLRSPIIVAYNKDTYDIYIDKFTKDSSNSYKLVNNLMPYKLRFSYIAKPAQVKYNEDLNKPNVECDMPEYMQIDILKHAVDLWRIAVTGSLQGAQQQEQAQQRENIRNSYAGGGAQTQ